MKRVLGFWMLTSLVIGNMIGSGIYLLPAALAHIGTVSLLSWVCSGLGATLLALVFARLSTQHPFTGGPYVYCKKGFGEYVGFQIAYNYWIYLGVGVAAIAIAFTGYLSACIPIIQHSAFYALLSSLTIVWCIIAINIAGVYFAGALQVLMTILKILPLLALTIFGFFWVSNVHLEAFNITTKSNFSALSEGAFLTLWAFLGLESACIPAGSVRNPKRFIPLATIVGTLAATAIYIGSTTVIMGVIPLEELQRSSAPFALLASLVFGPWGTIVVTLGALSSCVGTLNGWVLTQSQIALAASKDGLFPGMFGALSQRGTPAVGLLSSGLFISLLLCVTLNKTLVEQFTYIIMMATFTAIVSYLYTTLSAIILLRKSGVKKRIVPLVIASFAFIYVFWAIVSIDEHIVYLGTLLLFGGVVLYALRGKYELQENL